MPRLRPLPPQAQALSEAQAQLALQRLQGWRLEEAGHKLCKQYASPDFLSAMAQAERIGLLAEQENHHPELTIAWGRLTVRWWTHTLHGLDQNDFTMAQACDDLLAP